MPPVIKTSGSEVSVTTSKPRLTLQPVPRKALLADPGYYIWCGAPIRTPDGRYHLLYSRWPIQYGHHAWVSRSEIAYATSDRPLGPYQHQSVALPARGEEHWDGLCTHNPTILAADGRYYLYYTGMRGRYEQDVHDELNWSFRNQQRIGVAVADHPAGPWRRFDQPLIEAHDDQDRVCCSNPAVTQRPDGKFLMIYKLVRRRSAGPFYGPVVHIAALAHKPTGHFIDQTENVFGREGVHFPAEDPFIWCQNGWYHAIVKDMSGHFTEAGKSLVCFESDDGFDWSLADSPLLTVPRIHWENGEEKLLHSLERPQLLFDQGRPVALFCAADEDPHRTHSFNLHIPIEFLGSG